MMTRDVLTISFQQDGLESKNNKTRVVCAEELGVLIDAGGPALYRTAPATTKVSVKAFVSMPTALLRVQSLP